MGLLSRADTGGDWGHAPSGYLILGRSKDLF